jgi:hypothetical protein
MASAANEMILRHNTPGLLGRLFYASKSGVVPSSSDSAIRLSEMLAEWVRLMVRCVRAVKLGRVISRTDKLGSACSRHDPSLLP